MNTSFLIPSKKLKIALNKFFLLVLLVLSTSRSFAQENATLSGYVKDANNGETLIGATVLIKELSSGNITNVYGFYSITVPTGTYTVDYRYVGYQTITKTITLTSNRRVDVELPSGEQQLQEVVVSAEALDENVSSVEMSTAELDIETIEKIPAFLGEVDVVKSLQLLPGVSSVGEGASGFNVRGGSVGQNLILLDEAPVYNSSHMFGFFSVFNPDAVKDVKLYKGGIPAEYGGRLSSILDVRMKEGNMKKYEVNGGIGTIFSRFAVEGPLAKDKSSFILAGRRSYIDVLAKPFLKNQDGLEDIGLRFYDLTFKTNYNISDRDRVYLSGYLGRDVFAFDANQGFDWGNKTATLRWNHLFNDRIFSNTTLFVSDYDYSFQVGETRDDLFSWKSRIFTYNFKEQFSYFINTNNELSFGAEAILYRFKPAEVLGVSVGEESDISLAERKSLETAVYIGNDQKVNNKLSLQYGLRFSSFQYLGDGEVYEYGEPEQPGERKPIANVTQADNWETIQHYTNLEPRFSFRYSLNPTTSIKGSYNRMSQYIHLVSNTAASLPTDVWTPSSNNIKPQLADQVALGVFKNFWNNKLETSVEVYYKTMQNQIDYIDGAEILINRFLEGDLLAGDGRAYGAEFYLKKNSGKINGWVSYTLAKTERQVAGINDGDWYPTRYDQTHNLKISGNYDYSDRWSFAANFTYITGTPYTLPSYRYEVQGYTIPGVEGRNNGRIPDYHRLDLAATWQMRKFKNDGSPKKLQDYWVFTIYNVYQRRNPFSIYFAQKDGAAGDQALTEATQVAILGSFVPAVSYNFKF
ncbi:TonB-dependent receptor-like protein [Marinoscillum furvescens DSM 4134]|uniref:TonB-dependent receptor-like protein n=1 Tax=Marinoscillum furvescens DSM 4134 TaxID=1122208 RepID=A0A3D9L2B2_MARFU|nr:TonB-dependent receptor-like protein [Marinoscillum furvescens DSM 4134]